MLGPLFSSNLSLNASSPNDNSLGSFATKTSFTTDMAGGGLAAFFSRFQQAVRQLDKTQEGISSEIISPSTVAELENNARNDDEHTLTTLEQIEDILLTLQPQVLPEEQAQIDLLLEEVHQLLATQAQPIDADNVDPVDTDAFPAESVDTTPVFESVMPKAYEDNQTKALFDSPKTAETSLAQQKAMPAISSRIIQRLQNIQNVLAQLQTGAEVDTTLQTLHPSELTLLAKCCRQIEIKEALKIESLKNQTGNLESVLQSTLQNLSNVEIPESKIRALGLPLQQLQEIANNQQQPLEPAVLDKLANRITQLIERYENRSNTLRTTPISLVDRVKTVLAHTNIAALQTSITEQLNTIAPPPLNTLAVAKTLQQPLQNWAEHLPDTPAKTELLETMNTLANTTEPETLRDLAERILSQIKPIQTSETDPYKSFNVAEPWIDSQSLSSQTSQVQPTEPDKQVMDQLRALAAAQRTEGSERHIATSRQIVLQPNLPHVVQIQKTVAVFSKKTLPLQKHLASLLKQLPETEEKTLLENALNTLETLVPEKQPVKSFSQLQFEWLNKTTKPSHPLMGDTDQTAIALETPDMLNTETSLPESPPTLISSDQHDESLAPIQTSFSTSNKIANDSLTRASSSTQNSAEPESPQQQIIQAAKLSLHSGKKEMTLQLKPESLGSIKLSLSSNLENEVTARIIAQTPETKELLQKTLTDLVRSLEQAGVKLAKVEVVQANADTFENQSQFNGSQQQHNSSSNQQQSQQAFQNNGLDFNSANQQQSSQQQAPSSPFTDEGTSARLSDEASSAIPFDTDVEGEEVHGETTVSNEQGIDIRA